MSKTKGYGFCFLFEAPNLAAIPGKVLHGFWAKSDPLLGVIPVSVRLSGLA